MAGNSNAKEMMEEQKKLQDMLAECRANVSVMCSFV